MRYKTHRTTPKPVNCPRCHKTMGGIMHRVTLFVIRCDACGYAIDLDPPASSPVWAKIAEEATTGAGI